MHGFSKLKELLLLSGALALVSMGAIACGDDDGGGGDPDAAVDTTPDAATDEPDAAVAITTRSGLIGIAEARVMGLVAASVGGVEGASISVSYKDLSMISGTVDATHDNPVNGCQVITYNPGASESPDDGGVDEGAVSVTGTGAGPFACGFNAMLGEYKCQPADGLGSGAIAMDSTATTQANGTIVVSVTGLNLPTTYVGSHILFSGFDEANANQAFAIAGVAANTIVVVNDSTNPLPHPTTATAGAGSTYAVFVGEGPVAFGAGGFNGFLDDGTNDIEITKAAGAMVPAIDISGANALNANGSDPGDDPSFTLADASMEVHNVDMTAGASWTFTCNGVGGTCGKADGGLLNVITISGTAVNTAAAPVLIDFDLGEPDTHHVTFQCSMIGANSLTVPAEVVDLILGNPRVSNIEVQTQVAFMAGRIENVANVGSTNVVVGHAVVGFSPPPPI